MLAKTFSAVIQGIDSITVEIEINATGIGEQTTVSIVGLPDNAIRESRERVRSALDSCGFVQPIGHTTYDFKRPVSSTVEVPVLKAKEILPYWRMAA